MKKNSKSNYLSNTLTIEIDEHEKTSDAVPVEMDINMDADKHENNSDNNVSLISKETPIIENTVEPAFIPANYINSNVDFEVLRVSLSHRKCCICQKEAYNGKQNIKLNLVSQLAIRDVFKKTKILTPYGGW